MTDVARLRPSPREVVYPTSDGEPMAETDKHRDLTVYVIEALKAQAVAARTYALRVEAVARANHRDHDICATTACQVFGGYAWTRHGTYQILEGRSTNAAAALIALTSRPCP